MNTVQILLVAALCGSALLSNAAEQKPNFVVIMADDLGYADVGYHESNSGIETPRIDELAYNGIRFENGYSNGHVCSPTRAALLTGRYQNRIGCDYHIAPYKRAEEATIGLPLDAITLSERLKPLGYATGMTGKWHLGGELQEDRTLMPPSRGFDDFYGILEGAGLYFDPTVRERKYRRGYAVLDNEPDYYTDAIGREAIRFIRENREKPFLLYVPFTAPHAPRQAKQAHMEKFKHIEPLMRRELVSMVYSLDENVGRIMDELKATGLDENTLVVFLSDNGGKPNDNGSLNHPLRGEKAQFFEGGIHVPFCMSWKGTLPHGKAYEYPIMSMDIFPTIYNLAGGKIKKSWALDGVDLMPYLTGKRNGRPHETLFWKSDGDLAVRHKDWKLLRQYGETYLFNLADDPDEKKNLIAAYPEMEKELMKKYAAWDAQNMPPNYGWPLRKTGIHIERVPR
jgi:arylsulfatase A-like enzyme